MGGAGSLWMREQPGEHAVSWRQSPWALPLPLARASAPEGGGLACHGVSCLPSL